ncbi:uncharacterized protein LOC115996283 isoform X3 [Ipomoea triloba]|uniref:uncharacterized protein LOC115996283 isoform X3 n=1 Tax=Ipomoea triloba TaxID=35885 RepID=UPI00125DE995|nr:uncharacterized protein LOC115996283 isoform X3 [Ipomoea triloba]XP_031091332.1 uncharacterized protein LOC115996283 isoform X3 [Ipomoea triloba]
MCFVFKFSFSRMAEISEFEYAYFTSGPETIRIKIPMTSNSFEPEVELVFSNPSQPLPKAMGLFSHNHIVYMVGGYYLRDGLDDDVDDEGIGEVIDEVIDDEHQYFDLVHMFDPTKFDGIPFENIEQLENLSCGCMVFPSVIRAEDRIYLLSERDFFGYPFDVIFQYFDPNKNLFETLPPPPVDRKFDSHLLGVRCSFSLRGYIYVLITDTRTFLQTSKFNTTNSKWEDCKSMVDKFKEKNVPFPLFHAGDMGISDELVDNTWILVALNGGVLPIAYNVNFSDEGDIQPISHRVLAELYTSDFDMHGLGSDREQLADMGGGRFCVMYCALEEDFLIYGFNIDFELEHTIQRNETENSSSYIIFKMKFNHHDPFSLKHLLTGFCIASAPPPLASPDNEDQDKNDRKSKRKWGE